MRLKAIYEDHWQPIASHPGQLGKKDKRAKKNDMSFLVHPEDRKRWLKWFGGKKKIKEDLDDRDEFGDFDLRELITPDEISQVLSTGARNYFPLPFLQRMLKQGSVYLISKMEKPYALLTDNLRNTEGMASKKISEPLSRFLLQKIETGEIQGQAVGYVKQLIEHSRKLNKRVEAAITPWRSQNPLPGSHSLRRAGTAPQHESSFHQRRLVEDLDDKSDMFAAKLDDKDEFGFFAREEVANNIEKLRHLVATNTGGKHVADLLRSMERLYASEFGQPYNPAPPTPRM